MVGTSARPQATTTSSARYDVNLYGGMEVNSGVRHAVWFRGWAWSMRWARFANDNYLVFKKSSEDGADYYTMGNSRERRAAFFGTGTYSFKGRYIVNGTVRYEGSNRLGKSRTARRLPTLKCPGRWNAHERAVH